MELYLDNNATTPVDERVIAAASRALRDDFGNPSSPHAFGERAAAAVAEARSEVARLLGARGPREVVFTSCGTEANNAAIHAALHAPEVRAGGRRLLLSTAGEHASVLRPLERATTEGFELDLAPLAPDGRPRLEHLLDRLASDGARCALVSAQWANNETGVLLLDEELRALADAAHAAGATLHVDGVQAPGKLPMTVGELRADLVSVSAHKLHGPKGVGALYVRREFEEAAGLAPLLAGGAQEQDRRAGTQNVPGIVAFGVAARLAREHVEGAAGERGIDRLAARRDAFERALLARVPGARIHGADAPRLPNTSSVQFPDGIDGELLLTLLADAGLAASSGAACSATKKEPSHVLLALGLTPDEARASLRFSLSRMTTGEELDRAVELVADAVLELAGLAG